MTDQVAAAKAIRKELKDAFPGVKFSVRSDSFAGGNSVDIRWIDGPKAADVEEITGKYQYGHFNGMIDLYEYSNRRDDLPQAKYVSANRQLSAEYRQQIKDRVSRIFGVNMNNEQEVYAYFQCWSDSVIYRVSTGALDLDELE